MQRHSNLLLLAYFTLLTFVGDAIAADPPFDVRDVKKVRSVLLSWPDFEWSKEYQYLWRVGEKVFPAYESILSDPKASGAYEAASMFNMLCYVEADRRCFIKHARDRLKDEKLYVRHSAVDLLRRIGSSSEASPLVALLSDERWEIAHAAARALADIGGPNEVTAMEVWFRGVAHRDESGIRQYVQKQCNKLKKRLDEDNDPKKRAQKIYRCWKDLHIKASVDELVVQRAVWILAAFGNETVTFLKTHLHPMPAKSQKHFDQLIADLDSNSFECREAATRELSRGNVVDFALKKTLTNRLSLEQRKRLEVILNELPDWREKNPELLQQVRAVWVLQQIGTPEAKALLEKVAAGTPSARLTQKAKDALESLKNQK